MKPTSLAALAVAVIAVVLLSTCGDKPKQPAAAAKSPITETCEEDFCVVATRGSGRIDFDLKAKTTAPVTATLTFTLTNMTPTVGLPLTESFTGPSQKAILALDATDKAAAYSYKFDYQWGYGLPGASHDEATVYRLPFEVGKSFNVVQGYNGTFSHTGDDQYALDFAMPEGTAVFAARAGTVVSVIESFDAGGADPTFRPKVNGIKILHADGTIGEYLHLKKDGADVVKGDAVTLGQQLGSSGNTGFTSGPHLHFKVSRRVDGATAESLPIKFKTSAEAAVELEEGQSYTAVEVP